MATKGDKLEGTNSKQALSLVRYQEAINLCAPGNQQLATKQHSLYKESTVSSGDPEQIYEEYLETALGLSEEMIEALIGQGVEGFSVLASMTAKDIDQVCKNMRAPGGTVPNQQAGANQPASVPNRGVTLGFMREKRIKQLHYYVHHQARVQRRFSVAAATIENLDKYYDLFEEEEADKSELPAEPKKLERTSQFRTILEYMESILVSTRGATSKIPLSYVIRESSGVPAVDPGPGQPTLVDELIARAPHRGQHFAADNVAVWNLIEKVFHDGPAWSWVKAFKTTRNGRAAFLAAKSHYLGPAFQSKTKSEADRAINDLKYTGKSKSMTFEAFTSSLKEAYEELAHAGEPVPPAKKVRQLLDKVEASGMMDAAVAAVRLRQEMDEDFEGVCDFISRFARREEVSAKKKRMIAANRSSQPHDADADGGISGGGDEVETEEQESAFDPDNPGRYYTFTEYQTLSAAEQDMVYAARNDPKRKKGGQRGSKKKAKSQQDATEEEAS